MPKTLLIVEAYGEIEKQKSLVLWNGELYFKHALNHFEEPRWSVRDLKFHCLRCIFSILTPPLKSNHQVDGELRGVAFN